MTQRTTPAAVLTALGIVYGDIGTRPLYTLQTVQTVGVKFTPAAAPTDYSLKKICNLLNFDSCFQGDCP